MSGAVFRDRTLIFALAGSLFIHLSMVTLFSIEMHYEPKPIQYFPFDIVDISRFEQPAVHPDAVISLPTDAMAPFGGRPDAASYLASLPQIALPTLNFEGISDMALREPGLDIRTRDPRLFARQEPRDAWAQFGEEIQDLRDTLRGLPFIEGLAEPRLDMPRVAAPEEQSEDTLVRPAPGFVAHVEWMAEPKDRQLLMASPVVGPWTESAPGPAGTLTFMFQVAADGTVSEVVAPAGGERPLVDALTEALRGYRFEPRPGEAPQPAAFVVEPEPEGAP